MLARIFVSAGLAFVSAVPALAHTGYVLPNRFFLPEGGTVTTQAAFSEAFPQPEVALRSPAMSVIAPDGTSLAFDDQTTIGALTVLTSNLTTPGTYRLTTGKRLGRKGYVTDEGGLLVRATSKPDQSKLGDAIKILTSQTVTVSDVYVSVGEISDVMPVGLSRLTIGLNRHPNCLLDNQQIGFNIRFDDQPLAKHTVTILRPFGPYLGEGEGLEYRTDQFGNLSFSKLHAGLYLIMVRHLAYSPEGSETDVESYTTSLVIDVQGRGGSRKGCAY